jgi:hypothetical protein
MAKKTRVAKTANRTKTKTPKKAGSTPAARKRTRPLPGAKAHPRKSAATRVEKASAKGGSSKGKRGTSEGEAGGRSAKADEKTLANARLTTTTQLTKPRRRREVESYHDGRETEIAAEEQRVADEARDSEWDYEESDKYQEDREDDDTINWKGRHS